MQKLYALIDAVDVAINDTEDSRHMLQMAFDELYAKRHGVEDAAQLDELSREIHKCEDALLDLKLRRSMLLDEAFR